MMKIKYHGQKGKEQLTKFQKRSMDNYSGRFRYWQGKQIDLLTFSINLVFTVSVAVSGFILANNDKSIFNNKTLWNSYSLTKTTLFILVFSGTVGMIGLITRLNDLRLTKDLIRTRQRLFELQNDIKYEAYEPSDLDKQKARRDKLVRQSNRLGRFTWAMFYVQLLLFMFAVWTLVLTV